MVMGRKKIDVRENYISVHLWLLAKVLHSTKKLCSRLQNFGRKDSWLTFVFLEQQIKSFLQRFTEECKTFASEQKVS